MALPGLTSIFLTKEWTKALVSVSSLVLRNSLISSAKVAMVSALFRNCRRPISNALASSAATSSFSLRSRSSTMRSEASATSTLSLFAMKCQTRPNCFFTSSSSPSILSSICRCSRATPSISSSTIFTRSLMLDSVRMLARSSSTMIFSNFLALSLGVLQVPLPRLRREWQM